MLLSHSGVVMKNLKLLAVFPTRMTLTDILKMEEEKALLKPASGHMAQAQEDFPYLKHGPYIDWIITQGSVIRLEGEEPRPPLMALLDPENALLQFWKQNSARQRTLVEEAVRALQARHGFKYAEPELVSYHVQLAGRALSYAQSHFPGLETESANLSEVAREAASLPDEQMLKMVQQRLSDPTVQLSEAVHNIRLFYEKNTT